MTMTVNQLINELQQVQNKELPVFIFSWECELLDVNSIDNMSDRVDINAAEPRE